MDDEIVHHWKIDAWAKNWVDGDTDKELQTIALLSPDSPEAYKDFIKLHSYRDVESSVDCDGAHFSIAKVLVSMMPGVIENVHEVKTKFYQFDNHRWNRGGSTRMRLFLSSEAHAVYAQLLCDAKDLLSQAKGKDAGKEASLLARVKTLTRICCDLKNQGFKDSVIKEVAILTYDPHLWQLTRL